MASVDLGDLTTQMKLDTIAFFAAAATVNQAMDSLVDVAQPVGEAIASALGAAISEGIKFAAVVEQAGIGFETMLGSQGEAQQFIQDMKDIAALTPYNLEGLLKSSRILQGVGFDAEQTKGVILALGDAMSAAGGSADDLKVAIRAVSQIKSRGKLSGEEFTQLAEKGLPVWDMLAKKLGVTIPEAMNKVKKGGIGSAQALNALMEGISERYAGSMEAQSKSIAGMWSTVQDMFSIKMAESLSPALDAIKRALPELIELIQAASQSIGPMLGSSVAFVIDGLGYLASIFNSMSPTTQKVVGVVLGLSAGFLVLMGVLLPVVAALMAAGTAIVGSWGAITAAAAAAGSIGLALLQVGAAVAAVVAILAIFGTLFKSQLVSLWGYLVELASATWTALSKMGTAVSQFLSTLWKSVVVTGAWRHAMIDAFQYVGIAIWAFGSLASWLLSVWWSALTGLLGWWWDLVKAIVGAHVWMASTLWQGIKDLFNFIWIGLQGLGMMWEAAMSSMSSSSGGTWGLLASAGAWAMGLLVGGFSVLGQFVDGVFTGIRNAFLLTLQSMLSAMTSVVKSMEPLLAKMGISAGGTIKLLVAADASLDSAMAESVFTDIGQMVDGALAKFADMQSTVRGTLYEFSYSGESIMAKASGFWDSLKTTLGLLVPDSLVEGIEDYGKENDSATGSLAEYKDSLKGLTDETWNATKAVKEKKKKDKKKDDEEEEEAEDSPTMKGLMGDIFNASGLLADVISNVAKGFQIGGPWGALLAGLATLFANSAAFAGAIASLNVILQTAADFLGVLLSGFPTVLGAISILVGSIISAIRPLASSFGPALESIAPIFVIIATLVGTVLIVLQPLTGMLVWLADGIALLMKAIYYILLVITAMVTFLVWGIAIVWNAIVGAIQKLIQKLYDITGLEGLQGIIERLDGMKIDTTQMEDAANALISMTYEEALAQAQVAASLLETSEAADSLSESLVNIPGGFKVAMAAFNAIATRASDEIASMGLGSRASSIMGGAKIPALGDGGITRRPTLALIGEAGPEAVIPLSALGSMGGSSSIYIENLTVVSNDPNEFMRKLEALVAKRQSRSFGTPVTRRRR